MLTRFRPEASLTVWLLITCALWAVFVPEQISPATWIWSNLTVLALALMAITTWKRLTPPLTMAQILHDVEQSTKP